MACLVIRGLLFGPRSSGRLLGALCFMSTGLAAFVPHLWHRLGPAWLTPPVLGCLTGIVRLGFASGLLTRTRGPPAMGLLLGSFTLGLPCLLGTIALRLPGLLRTSGCGWLLGLRLARSYGFSFPFGLVRTGSRFRLGSRPF